MLLSWCGWHMQVLCNFMKMLTWACYEAFVTMAEQKGATAAKRKWCHGNILVLVTWLRYQCKREECGCVEHARDREWSRIPGVPHDGGMANKEPAKTIRSWCKTRASHTTHMHSFTGVVSGLYLWSVRFRTDQVRYDVEEVVVHGSSWEVVVHVS